MQVHSPEPFVAMEAEAELTSSDVLLCSNAQPQAPRNLDPAFIGDLEAPYEPVDGEVVNDFIQVNLHFHLGAEHYSPGEYDIAPQDTGFGRFRSQLSGRASKNFWCLKPYYRHLKYCQHYLAGVIDELDWLVQYNEKTNPPMPDVRPGFFCGLEGIHRWYLHPYKFRYCEDVKVGYTYEFHWVYSSAGPLSSQPAVYPGLGQVFNRSVTPVVIVRGQVCRIINNWHLKTKRQVYADYNNFLYQWRQPSIADAVRYVGSTTSDAYDNNVCSPVEVNWHMDTKCCTLSAQAMDLTCKKMKAQGLTGDLRPQSSRELVARDWSSTVAYPLEESEDIPAVRH